MEEFCLLLLMKPKDPASSIIIVFMHIARDSLVMKTLL